MEHKFALNLATAIEDKLCCNTYLMPISDSDDFIAFSAQVIAFISLGNSRLPIVMKRRLDESLNTSGECLHNNFHKAEPLNSRVSSIIAHFDNGDLSKQDDVIFFDLYNLKFGDESKPDKNQDMKDSFIIEHTKYDLDYHGFQYLIDFCTSKHQQFLIATCMTPSGPQLNIFDIETKKNLQSIDYNKIIKTQKNLNFGAQKNDKLFSGTFTDPTSLFLTSNISSKPIVLHHDIRKMSTTINQEYYQINDSIPKSLTIIKSFDQNPRQTNIIAFGGDSSSFYVFDSRNNLKPLLEICQHSNDIIKLKFNTFFDQLILSAGIDGHGVVSNLNYYQDSHDLSKNWKLAQNSDLINDISLNLLTDAAWMENDPFRVAIVDSNGIVGVHEMNHESREKVLQYSSKLPTDPTMNTESQ